ncbi:uncharacterized protein LOC141595588 [Silene latifolia]|uniref:uncharacterized protein LOC141595588 n=1 Tax=Silene latifolia TaxID=37657 RepID=UPI003D76E88B
MDLQPPQSASVVQPGSTDSSPKSTHHGEWDEPLAPLPGAKLRLMCSYGGHIIPRPHDKSLCYVGGETRMVVVERSSCLQDLISRLSKTLLDGRQFTLKYQLPNEELDSLISVATDEDLENMVEEHDRIMAIASSLKPSSGRLRLFLFFIKPETSVTMGALLDDAKSETWFVDALNGANMLPRGFSDSAAMDDLLSLGSGVTDSGLGSGLTAQVAGAGSDVSAQTVKISSPQDIHLIQSMMPDSPMIETNTSSFDSSTSSPSMAHLAPIRVRADEPSGLPLEDQLSTQMRLTPPLPTTILTQNAVPATHYAVGGGTEINFQSRVVSDEEKSDHGVHAASRKPPLPLSLQHGHQRFGAGFNLPSPDSKHAAGFSLPSPDSVKSDSSIASGTSFTKVPNQQEADQVNFVENHPPTATTPDQNLLDGHTYTPPNQNQLQPIQDATAYIYPPPAQHQDQPHHQHPHQHQYIQPNMQYIPAHVPLQSYYPAYPTPQQSLPPHQIDQHSQYPLYILQTQPSYNNISVPPAESTVTSSAAQSHQPVYQTRPGMAQLPTNSAQYHQYLGPYNPTPGRPTMTGNPVPYGNYDYSHQQQLQHQVYYTGQVPAGSQYQSITPAQAAMIAEASMQSPTADSSKQPPRTS